MRIQALAAAVIALPALAMGAENDFARALAPSGTLRATFLNGNTTQGTVDPATGAVSGPAADLTRELARRLGVTASITPVAGVRAVIDSVKSHSADIGFLAFDPTRATEVEFSQVYSLGWSTYLVKADSPLRAVADVDRSGIRVAANAGDSPDLFLTRNLKNATMTHIPGGNTKEALRMLAAGEIDAYGTNRARVEDLAAANAGVRVLPDNFFAVEQAIVVAKGNAAALEAVNRFLDDARTSGFIRESITRSKVKGLDVAPRK